MNGAGRQIHARTQRGVLIVRYDKAGKWYAEHPARGRSALTIREAVALATAPGSYVYFGRPGGKTFDARVRTAVPASDEEEGTQ